MKRVVSSLSNLFVLGHFSHQKIRRTGAPEGSLLVSGSASTVSYLLRPALMNLHESPCLNQVKFTLIKLVHKFYVFINIFCCFPQLKEDATKKRKKTSKKGKRSKAH